MSLTKPSRGPTAMLGILSAAERFSLERYLLNEIHRVDPAVWVNERLGEFLWSAQREIAVAVRDHRRVAVRSAQDVGKSRIASRLACWWIDTHPVGDAFVVTTAPSFKQVQAVLWREMRHAHRAGSLPGLMNETEWKIDGRLVAFGRKPADYDPEAFQGIHARHVLVVLDEAGGIDEPLWIAAETLTANEGSRILAIGNPDDPTSHFAKVSSPGSGWHQIRIDGYRSPNFTGEPVPEELRALLLSRTWVEERKRSWGEDSPLFVSKVRGEFPEEADDALIPMSWIRAAQVRFETDLDEAEGSVILGVDVARYGSSETVIVARRGERAWISGRYRKQDTMATAGRVLRAIQELGAKEARVDVVGIGAGVVDRLKEQHQPVVGLNAGTAPHEKARFANARAEWFWTLRDRFERSEIAVCPDDELAAQLVGIRYEIDSSGRIKIESKEDARLRGVASPDIVDALVLAFSDRRRSSKGVPMPIGMWRQSPWDA